MFLVCSNYLQSVRSLLGGGGGGGGESEWTERRPAPSVESCCCLQSDVWSLNWELQSITHISRPQCVWHLQKQMKLIWTRWKWNSEKSRTEMYRTKLSWGAFAFIFQCQGEKSWVWLEANIIESEIQTSKVHLNWSGSKLSYKRAVLDRLGVKRPQSSDIIHDIFWKVVLLALFKPDSSSDQKLSEQQQKLSPLTSESFSVVYSNSL